ncbi:MAG: hypothetical protein BZ136_08815 [Methanosphaera sp. rholeuAM74]|nr:MAG: hypothetical protein BZ136_08815 [Methanosphaera sp. rholeuAM74]
MEKNKIIGIIVAVLLLAVIGYGAYTMFNTGSNTLAVNDTLITLPDGYSIDNDTNIATKGNVNIMFVSASSGAEYQMNFSKMLNECGNISGYSNIREDEVNGFKIYEYGGKTGDFKNMSTTEHTSEATVTHTMYPQYFYDKTDTEIHPDYVRVLNIITPSNEADQILVFSNDSGADLYSQEINDTIRTLNTTK